MQEENRVLLLLFPKMFWEGEKNIDYDFISNSKRVKDIIDAYLNNEKLPQNEEQEKFYEKVTKLVERTFDKDKIKIHKPKENNQAFKLAWAKSLIDFFKFGFRLQQEGKKPKIYINW